MSFEDKKLLHLLLDNILATSTDLGKNIVRLSELMIGAEMVERKIPHLNTAAELTSRGAQLLMGFADSWPQVVDKYEEYAREVKKSILN
jgi:hypothetical protein